MVLTTNVIQFQFLEVDAPASPAPFLARTEQEREVAHYINNRATRTQTEDLVQDPTRA